MGVIGKDERNGKDIFFLFITISFLVSRVVIIVLITQLGNERFIEK